MHISVFVCVCAALGNNVHTNTAREVQTIENT